MATEMTRAAVSYIIPKEVDNLMNKNVVSTADNLKKRETRCCS